jgi:DDE family transposase
MGRPRHPHASELLIMADGGGSNGSRCRLWKVALQDLADQLQMSIRVCHFPPEELGVTYSRLKDWAPKGYFHLRRVGNRKYLVIWAAEEEQDRLRRLRDAFHPGRTCRYPAELTRPEARPESKRRRSVKPSDAETSARPDK